MNIYVVRIIYLINRNNILLVRRDFVTQGPLVSTVSSSGASFAGSQFQVILYHVCLGGPGKLTITYFEVLQTSMRRPTSEAKDTHMIRIAGGIYVLIVPVFKSSIILNKKLRVTAVHYNTKNRQTIMEGYYTINSSTDG